MRVLLTNDDGIFAPGLEAMCRELAEVGEVAVAAPASPQTGVGHGISVLTPMAVQRVPVEGASEGWSVDGRPADCVKLAMIELLGWRPDFVVSGINAGLNTGMYMLYSGTVAAAAEAAVFFRVPSMAVSLQVSPSPEYARAARVARRILECYVAAAPKPGSCLNVNIPSLGGGLPKGVHVCPQTLVTTDTVYRKETNAAGLTAYRFDGGDPELTAHPNTDTAAVREGYVAVTPLTFAMTDQAMLADMAAWVWPARLD